MIILNMLKYIIRNIKIYYYYQSVKYFFIKNFLFLNFMKYYIVIKDIYLYIFYCKIKNVFILNFNIIIYYFKIRFKIFHYEIYFEFFFFLKYNLWCKFIILKDLFFYYYFLKDNSKIRINISLFCNEFPIDKKYRVVYGTIWKIWNIFKNIIIWIIFVQCLKNIQ